MRLTGRSNGPLVRGVSALSACSRIRPARRGSFPIRSSAVRNGFAAKERPKRVASATIVRLQRVAELDEDARAIRPVAECGESATIGTFRGGNVEAGKVGAESLDGVDAFIGDLVGQGHGELGVAHVQEVAVGHEAGGGPAPLDAYGAEAFEASVDVSGLRRGEYHVPVRVVPPATARYGSYIAPGVVMMPSYVNIGAYVDEGTMVDSHALVGSCAQIGKRVHLSAGAQIGGVTGARAPLRRVASGGRGHRAVRARHRRPRRRS